MSITSAPRSEPQTSEPPVRRRPRRTRAMVLAAVVVVVAAAAAVAAFGIDFSSKPATSAIRMPPARATVTRMTLTDTEKVNGTLGYGEAHLVTVRGTGTITWLPSEGSLVQRGQAVFRRDDLPVPLFLGPLPFYRLLRDGVSGADVKELEENLAALGYKGFTVDNDFTASTADAVRAWQADLGLKQTGTVDATLVVLAPAAIRVADVHANVGDPATGGLLTYTGTTRLVNVALDVSKQDLVKVGIAATVTLPDNSTVDGKVTSVGTVATTSGGGAGQPTSTTIAVEVSLSDQQKLGSLDAAPVSVTLVSQTRPNVLTVPVGALLALSGGGYGVQVIDGDRTYYVAVTTGLFANGQVEVSGAGIAEGTVVGMPA